MKASEVAVGCENHREHTNCRLPQVELAELQAAFTTYLLEFLDELPALLRSKRELVVITFRSKKI